MMDATTAQTMAYCIGYGGLVGFGGGMLAVLAVEGLAALFRAFKAIAGGRS